MSEAKRSLIRIGSNYTRLFLNVAFGLVLARILLKALGNDAWGLIALLGSTVGLAVMIQQIVDTSMIRELGEAHHHPNPDVFLRTYNSALLLALCVALLSLLLMGLLLALLPIFNIPDHLISAARWLVVARSSESLIYILAAPAFNMYKVTERMTAFNGCLILDRSSRITTALLLFTIMPDLPIDRGLILFACGSSGLAIVYKIIEVAIIVIRDPRLRPRAKYISRDALRRILHVGGWNTTTVTAMNLHLRIDSVIMNLFFGLFGNVIFGLTAQLGSYVRMMTMGMTEGIDAVSARISSTESDEKLQRLLYHTTRMHGLVAIPAAVGMFLLAEPILVAWVGDRLENPELTLAPTVLLIRLLTIGMVCRAIGDGWTFLLYGAGYVRRYAPIILVGGLANPILAIALILLIPSTRDFTGPALSYSIIFLVTHLILIPIRVSSCLEVPLGRVYAPLLRPLLVTAICTPLLFVLPRFISVSSLAGLAVTVIAFSTIYGVLSLFIVFEKTERQRLIRAGRMAVRGKADANQTTIDR